MKTTYQIGYFEETSDGLQWQTLKTVKRECDAQAEAEIDSLKKATPTTLDGDARNGLHIKRGKVNWFRRFSCHA